MIGRNEAGPSAKSHDGGRGGNGNGRARAGPVMLPLLSLPQRVVKQVARPAQSNIPGDRAVRDRLSHLAAAYVEQAGLIPPVGMDELRNYAG
ncbi:MAG: hypothetical protein ACE5FC_08540, partial [Myxococcota bacterium]